MKQKRHNPDQIIRKLREAELMKADGKAVAEICQALEISEQTFHRWKARYGGADANVARRVRELEEENKRLKKAVAELTIDKQILKEVAEGNF
jgi:putative transposase